MNIFFLSKDPVAAAEWHVDSHVVKMPLEAAQLMSTAHNVLDGTKPGLYKTTHKNHPCAIWVRTSKANYDWTFEYYNALLKEYSDRYYKTHGCILLRKRLRNAPNNIPDVGFTTPPLAMPDEYKIGDFVESYREYYLKGKADLHKWRRNKPYWTN